VRTTAADTDPAKYAQLFLGAWPRSSTDNADSAQTQLPQSLAPTSTCPTFSPVRIDASVGDGRAQLAARSRPVVVTVVTQYADASVRQYAVPVVTAIRAAFSNGQP
jgi:hypothetical protein